LDSGKTITDCLDEIGGEVPDFFQWYGELIDKTFGKVVPTGEDAAAFIVKEPVGVVGLVVPWNFPLLMAAWKMAPALAAGCSVIVKPAEQTPLTAIRLAQLAEDAGVPPGVINILPGFGETAGEALGRHSDVDVMSFTGSTEVGGYFLKYSSESNLKTVGLEMGGKSPFIILDDAEITDDLIENAVSSAFWNGGQNCSANMRQIVDKRLKDDYLHRIIKLTESYKVGEPLDPNTDLGSMITQEHQQRVLSYIAKGCDEGANLIAGKNGAMDRDGYFIQPTIFDNVDPQSTIAKEEIFGPVLGVVTVDGMDEALRIARDTEYGLHATVFTKDISRAFHMARHLPVGTVGINGFTEGDIKTPFGGFKKSGSLARDNGTEAMDQYLQTKTIWFNL
jgi:aldehyde dehydrogenase (NAD+)/gamma-glutamyl-gamma-aminobutyraldehyde dehydrogenase